MERLQSTRHDAHALQARMVRPLPKDSEHNGLPARATRKPAANKRGRSSHAAPRSYAGKERPLAGSAPFLSVWNDYNPRGTTRTPCKRAWCALSRKTASTMACPRVPPESRLQKKEVAARTPRHGLTPAKRGLSLVQHPFIACRASETHAIRRARTASAHDAPQARTMRPLPRDSERSGTLARATGKPAAQREGRSSHVKPRSCTGEERTLADATPFRSAWSEYNPRRTARAHYKCAWRAPSQETASTAACPRVPTESRLQKKEVAARTSNHGLTPAKGGLSLVQRPFIAYGATTTHAARRARTTSAHGALPHKRQRAQRLARACHPKAGCKKIRGRSSHVAPRSYTGEERCRAGSAPFHSVRLGGPIARCDVTHPASWFGLLHRWWVP